MSRNTASLLHHHAHLWLVGIVGVLGGLLLMILVPKLPVVSHTVLLFAGFHLVGGVVLLSSLYLMAGRPLRPWRAAPATDTASAYDFGWAPAWRFGPWLAALLLAAVAVALPIGWPAAWPLAMVIAVLATGFFAGGLFARAVARYDHALLPMVDWLPTATGRVLDAGCGAGRTTVALGRALRGIRIVALDRFDSGYIEGGGRALLDRNLRLAGLHERVQIEQADLTALPFPDASFDAVVSAHVIDHLGAQTEAGLRQVARVLKPGGRFLLIVWIPGWTLFSIANVLALLLKPPAFWRRITHTVGFSLIDEGYFNGYWFAVLEKPKLH